jgi:hypothetical protein
LLPIATHLTAASIAANNITSATVQVYSFIRSPWFKSISELLRHREFAGMVSSIAPETPSSTSHQDYSTIQLMECEFFSSL